MTVQDEAREIRSVLLGAGRVLTEFGCFEIRSFARYSGTNPRTGTSVVVPARHLVFLLPRPAFVVDVLTSVDRQRTTEEETLLSERTDASFVTCSEGYARVVEQLRLAKVTPVPARPDDDAGIRSAWGDLQPLDSVPFADLGGFALYRGHVSDEDRMVTKLVFRPSESLIAMIEEQFKEPEPHEKP